MAKIHQTWSGSLAGRSIPMETGRIWIDGCFDAMHFGHARLLLMSRSIGTTTVVEVHSDDEIQVVKGPVLMPLQERVLLVAACRWVSEVVPCAPYHTQTQWVDHFGASGAAHGDDIALDENNRDSLAEMKAAGRYRLIKRFQGTGTLSTTNLIDRILYPREYHHLTRNIVTKVKLKDSSCEPLDERELDASRLLGKINLFAHTQDSGKTPAAVFELAENDGSYSVNEIVSGCGPSSGQRIVYADGSFDLFTAGHVAFLEAIMSIEKRQQKMSEPYLIIGIYDDETVSQSKGSGSPVMNMVERALMLLQCRYVSAVILTAPMIPTINLFFLLCPRGVSAVYFGAVTFGRSPRKHDRYTELENSGMLIEVEGHSYQHVTAELIRHRVMEQREAFLSRQRAKGSEQKGDA